MIPESHYAARKPQHDTRSFIYVCSDSVDDDGNKTQGSFIIEETGEVKPRTALPALLLAWDRGELPVVITNDAASVVKELDDVLSGHPSWVWRATPLRRTKRGAGKPKESKPAVSVHLNPLYCGFRRVNGHTQNRYFHFVDCVQVTGRTSRNLYPEKSEAESLIAWAESYRNLCRENGVSITGQRGRFGGAMLRDPRFIGDSRRRIPAIVNETVRPHLPGNHYDLRAKPEETTQAIYLDITNAHHEAAGKTEFPDPTGLRIRGKRMADWETLDESSEPWAKSGSRKFERLLRTHGLVLLQALYRGTSKDAIVHPAARNATVNRPNLIYAYSNELELLRNSGFELLGAHGAITSGRTDDSLNRYASHAVASLTRASKEDRPWMKSLFLSTYGMLGKRASTYQSVSNIGGNVFNWPTSSGWLEGGKRETHKEYSPATTNVLALGMIQAETRRNVIELARHLDSVGVAVLALYADSLIVKVGDGDTIPMLPPEWRIKTGLTNLRFFNAVSWIADEEERMPGVGRDALLRESRRRAIRARARELGSPPSDWLQQQAAECGIGRRIPTNA